MNYYNYFLKNILLLVIITSISCNIHIEKKRYSKGYHIHNKENGVTLATNKPINDVQFELKGDSLTQIEINNHLAFNQIEIEHPKPIKAKLNFINNPKYTSNTIDQLNNKPLVEEDDMEVEEKKSKKLTKTQKLISIILLSLLGLSLAGGIAYLSYGILIGGNLLKAVSLFVFGNLLIGIGLSYFIKLIKDKSNTKSPVKPIAIFIFSLIVLTILISLFDSGLNE